MFEHQIPLRLRAELQLEPDGQHPDGQGASKTKSESVGWDRGMGVVRRASLEAFTEKGIMYVIILQTSASSISPVFLLNDFIQLSF